jgi:hypothetical protein
MDLLHESSLLVLQDELLWGAAWLFKASNDTAYLQYVVNNRGLSSEMNEFSWDNKNAGAQILLSKVKSIHKQRAYVNESGMTFQNTFSPHYNLLPTP